MISRKLNLAEVAAVIAARLAEGGIKICVVGGSAITIHEPNVYVSHDIDPAILTGIDRRKIELVLRTIGYKREGRIFVHPQSEWTVDIVADTPYIASRPITTYASIDTKFGAIRTYQLEDALADRIAAFLFWSDSQSLSVAERLVARRARDLDWPRLVAALGSLDADDPASAERLTFATRRLRRKFDENSGTS